MKLWNYRFASHTKFPWQYENPTHLPGGSQSVAHQFIRCVLHQLAPNGIFYQMFLTQIRGNSIWHHGLCKISFSFYHSLFLERQRKKYFKSIARALHDFSELGPTTPIHLLVESLNSKKTLPVETLPVILRNMGEYLGFILLDANITSVSWNQVNQDIETLFRRLVLVLNNLDDPDYLLHIMVGALKIPSVSKVSFN